MYAIRSYYDQRDGAAMGIGVGYGQRNALAPLGVGLDDHELAGLALAGYVRGLHLDAEYLVGQAGLRYSYNFV